jgi:aspartyl protease family protein
MLKRLGFLCGFLIVVSTSAFAQNPLSTGGSEIQLECSIRYASAQDRDPIVSVSIDIGSHEFAIVHHSHAGTTFNRMDQYRVLESGWNGQTFSWRGVFIKNPSQTLVGELKYADGGIQYEERIFTQSHPTQVSWIQQSTCLGNPVQRITTQPSQAKCTVADPTGTPLNVRATPAGLLQSKVLYNGSNVSIREIRRDARGKAWALVGGPDGSVYGWVFRDYLNCEEASVSPPPTPTTSGQSPPAQGSTSGASISIPMQIQGGIYVVPVLINDAITLDFIVDSGAADVSIPADVVMTLMRTGTLRDSDFLGEKTYVLADGSEVPSQTFRIRSLKVGNRVLENVNGSVASVKGSLLLGQSFLSQFKSWSVDNGRHALLLSE